MTPDTPILQLGVAVSDLKLTVPEGGSNTYTVLSHRPGGDVTVTVNNPTDNLEVTATPRSLTFTAENWDEPQAVTVAAVQDGDALDDSATVTHGVSGGGYGDVSAPDVAVTVTDDETLGVVISPTTIAVQAGGSNTYSVVLGSQPAGDVTVTVSGQAGTDLSLGGLSPTNTLTFSTGNWNTAREVTVGAAEDADAGEVTLSHGVSSADDPEYAALDADDVVVTVIPMTPDTPILQLGVAVSDLKLTVPEGGSNTYTIVLSHRPGGDVTVTVNNPTDNLEVTATPRSLTFTAENWDEPQAVTVAAVQDGDALDDSATVTHGVSGGGYGDVSAPDVAVTVTDDETLGVVISPTAIAVQAGGSNTYSVVLGSQPAGDVTVTVSGQAGTDLSLGGLSPTNTLTFSTGNWNTAREVTVGAAEDADAGEVTLSHGVSSADDPEYAALDADDVVVTVIPMTPDTPILQLGVAVSDLKLTVPEGGSNTYTIVLSHQPGGDVTVTVNNPTDNLEVTATPRSLTFSAENWNEPQAVTVAAVQDGDALDDSATVTHGVSGGGYGDVSAPDVAVTVTDDDRGIVLDPTKLSVVEGDAGGESYTVKLAAQPTVEVTVTVTGQDQTDLELTGLGPANTLTFSTTSWNDAQTVTVKATQDGDGSDDKVTLTHTAAGGEYAGTTADLPVTVTDDDRGIVLDPTKLSVVEGDAGGESYTVKLAAQPTVEVTVTVTGQDQTDLELTGLGEGDTLTFSTTSWNDAQTVTVKATQDGDGSDDKVTLTHTAAGGEYQGVLPDLAVTVTDDDRGIVLDPTKLSVVEGDAGGESYTVKLAAQPTVEVTVTVTGQDQTDLELTGLGPANTLTFSTTSWNDAQTVTVKAREDTDAKNDSVTLTHTGAGGEYEGVTEDLPVTVTDDDSIDQVPLLESVRVRFTNAATAIPEGGTVTVVVSLTEALTQDVTIPLTRTNQAGAGDADYSGVPASLAFGSGDTQQSFTFSATVDSEDEDEEQVVLGFGTLPEGVAQGTVSQATITILDVPSVSFGASDYSATEGGEDAMVTVQLSEALAADLTVPLTAEGGGGATPEDWSGVPSEVTFSAGDTSKTFTVVAVDDTVEDDDEMVHLGFGSLPSGFNAGPIASATVTLMNDEVMDSCVGSKIWCATITLEGWITDPPYETYHIAVWDRGLPEWAETEREFTYGGVTYAVSAVLLNPDPLPNEAHRSTFRLSFREDHIYNPPSEDHIAQWRLHVGDIQLEFEDAIARLGDGDYIWAGAGFRPISKGGTNLTLRIESTEENTHEYTPVASNSRPTGELIVTGEARVRSTLTMDASGISDPDGRVHSDFRYTWWVVYASYSGSNHRDDGTMYTVEPELEGLRIQGRVTFTDDAGNREAVMSAMTPIICAADGEIEPCEATVPQDVGNAPPENSPATGKPAITGAAEVGETLTASTGAIADPDGLTPATFSYQWARDDGSASTDISDATASTYTLQEEDLDRQVSVTVSFTDEAGYQEMLTSDSVYVQPPSPLYGGFDSTTLPSEHEGSNTFTFEIHFSEEPVLGFEAVREYVLDVTNGDVTSVRRTTQGSNIRWEITVQPDGNDEVTLVLPITTDCDDQGAVCTSSEKMLSNKSSVTIAGPPETAQQVQPENSPATSAPTVTGTARVGETLTADTSGIADADGLQDATFSHQWVSSDGATDSDIPGENGATYEVAPGDAGKTIRVRVSFTDDAGNDETLTSAATAAVAATVPGTPRSLQVQTEGTGELAVTWQEPESNGGSDVTGYRVQWKLATGSWDTEADVSSATATGTSYTITSLALDTEYAVRVIAANGAGDGPPSDEETETARARASEQQDSTPNTAATGAPTISGKAQAGETLTADTSGIADEDGLDNAAFSYQWIRSDGTTDSDIQDATGSTYTLEAADGGKTIKVRVSFTDDQSNQETLTSAATEAVTFPIWSSTLIAGSSGTQSGYSLLQEIGALSPKDFSVGVAGYIVRLVLEDNDGSLSFGLDRKLPAPFTLHIGTVGLDSEEATGPISENGSAYTYVWDGETGNLPDGEEVDLRLTMPYMPLTAVFEAVPEESHDGENSFTFELQFSEEFPISYETLRDHAFTVNGGSVTDAQRLDPPGNIRWEIAVEPSSDTEVSIVLPETTDCGDEGAICTGDDRMLSTEVTLTVGGPVEEEEQTPPENNPATGLPIISGTAQVGETLTADTSGIADEDGLDNAAFSYQWLADDTAISGSTGSTYTLAAADEGKVIKVRVSFTDDGGNDESLTSGDSIGGSCCQHSGNRRAHDQRHRAGGRDARGLNVGDIRRRRPYRSFLHLPVGAERREL